MRVLLLTSVFSALLMFSGHAQSIERIQFSGLASDNNNFQPVAGSPFGTYMSGGAGSLTVASEYEKNTFIPLQVKIMDRPMVDVSVYPNPSSDEVFIDWKSGDPAGQFLVLLDANGKDVRNEPVKSSHVSLMLKDVAAGNFNSSITGLSPGTVYYVRAYATNSAGRAYGNQQTLTTATSSNPVDADGNVYNTVTIGTQVWMKENLKVSKYRNGDPIPTGLSKTAWQNATTGAYAIYKKNAANNSTYGKLYNWYAVADSRSLCPVGWHIPTDDEWTTLENYLGGSDVAGGKLKSTSTLWNAPNTSATNESGFSGLPGGARRPDGTYGDVGILGNWWSSTESSTTYAWFRFLIDNYGYSGCNFYTSKQLGSSVRCLRD
jgi:uncharacterized protein (TIGR02145 family)